MSYQQPPSYGSPPAGPPPGWYPDPNGLQLLRWWDGRHWGLQTQPLPAPMQEPRPPYSGVPAPGTGGYVAFADQQWGSGQEGDTAYAPGWPPGPVMSAAPPAPRSAGPGPWAWAVASAPLLLLGVAALAAVLASVNTSISTCLLIGGLVANVFAIFAAYRDTRALRAAGEPVSSGLAWWCLLVPWAYLWARAVKRVNKSGADWGLFAGSVAAWLLIIVIAAPVVGSAITTAETFNRARVQADIAKGIKNQSGVAVTVDCPQEPSLNPGSRFQCVATAADGSTTPVTVIIQDRSGDYIWQSGG